MRGGGGGAQQSRCARWSALYFERLSHRRRPSHKDCIGPHPVAAARAIDQRRECGRRAACGQPHGRGEGGRVLKQHDEVDAWQVFIVLRASPDSEIRRKEAVCGRPRAQLAARHVLAHDGHPGEACESAAAIVSLSSARAVSCRRDGRFHEAGWRCVVDDERRSRARMIASNRRERALQEPAIARVHDVRSNDEERAMMVCAHHVGKMIGPPRMRERKQTASKAEARGAPISYGSSVGGGGTLAPNRIATTSACSLDRFGSRRLACAVEFCSSSTMCVSPFISDNSLAQSEASDHIRAGSAESSVSLG